MCVGGVEGQFLVIPHYFIVCAVPYCVYYFIIAQKWSRTPDQHDKVGNYTCIKIQNTLFQGVPNKLPFWNFGRRDPYDTLGPFRTSGP